MSKQNGNSVLSSLKSMALGACVSMVMALVLCGTGAILLSTERVGEDSIGAITVVTLMVSSIIGALTAIRQAGQQKLLVSIGTGCVFYLMLLACTAMFFDGAYYGLGATALVILAGCCCGALLSLRENKPKTRGSKYHNMKLVQNRQMGN